MFYNKFIYAEQNIKIKLQVLIVQKTVGLKKQTEYKLFENVFF